MVGTLLARGMLVGLVAGILALLVAELLGEPPVERAIGFEEETAQTEAAGGHDHAAPAAAEEELVSRAVQGTFGLAAGVLTYGAAVGGLFALAYAGAQGRLGRLGPRPTAALVAAAAFVAVYLVPALKYPPSPPAIGDPETIAYRTELYFFMVLVSLLALALAISLGRGLRARLGAWNGTVAAAAVFLGIVAAAQLILPAIDEVPAAFPAATLWQFRLASLAIQLTLWTTLGLLFGSLTERAARTGRGGIPGRGRAVVR